MTAARRPPPVPQRATGTALVLAALAPGLVLSAPEASAQRALVVTPTYQQSFAAYQSGVGDPVLGAHSFHAWGIMLGLERPGRWWQPHLWFQQYELGQPCATPDPVFDCTNDGWALSVGPGLQVMRTPTVTAMILPQVGLQGRGEGFSGGAGFHLGLDLEVVRPSAFGRYHVIRGVHFGTIGVGLDFRLPLDRPDRR